MKCIYIVFIVLFYSQVVFADSYSDIQINSKPEYPQPNQIISLSLNSYSYNLTNSHISWYVDDTKFKEGVGLTSVAIKAPTIDTKSVISAHVNDSIIVSKTIAPSYIDILWEANTYTPVWYAGRALPTQGSKITATVMPVLNSNIQVGSLIFNWSKNGNLLKDFSGIDKKTITINSPNLYNDYILEVSVSDLSGNILGNNSVKISTIEPKVYLYKHRPLIGTVFYDAINTASNIINAEQSIDAIPYYFNVKNPHDLTYKWEISGAKYIQNSKNNVSILQSIGSTILSVKASAKKTFLQSAQIKYIFDENAQQTSLINDNNTKVYQSPFGNNIE
jgi:hypothetical protein